MIGEYFLRNLPGIIMATVVQVLILLAAGVATLEVY
jgi:hypothetical protein